MVDETAQYFDSLRFSRILIIFGENMKLSISQHVFSSCHERFSIFCDKSSPVCSRGGDLRDSETNWLPVCVGSCLRIRCLMRAPWPMADNTSCFANSGFVLPRWLMMVKSTVSPTFFLPLNHLAAASVSLVRFATLRVLGHCNSFLAS